MGVDVFWLAVALPLFAGTGLSFLVERLLQPGTLPLWKRQPAALMIHIGALVVVVCLCACGAPAALVRVSHRTGLSAFRGAGQQCQVSFLARAFHFSGFRLFYRCLEIPSAVSAIFRGGPGVACRVGVRGWLCLPG